MGEIEVYEDVEFKVEEVRGWPLAILGGAAYIEDEELGRRLGYAEPRKVRDLVRRMFNDSELRRTVRQSAGRPAGVFFLTRAQALKVVMRSETPTADALQDEIIAVFQAWLDGRLAPASPASDMPPWARTLLEGIGGGVQAAQTEARQATTTATRAEETAKQAAEDAKVARAMADQAVLLVGSRSVLDAVSDATAPGRATETPDGAVAKRAPDGFKAMRAVARDYSLPRSGEGAALVSRIADALGVFEDPKLFFVQDVVIGGRVKNQHRMYSPAALELLDKPLRAAHALMTGLGYVATVGGAMRPIRTGTRSRKWVIAQMYDAAIATSAPPASEQADLFPKAS